MIFKKFIFLLSVCLACVSSYGQSQPPKSENSTRILIIFDASNSMYGHWQSDTKINIAKRLLNNILDSISTIENLQLALRVFGDLKDFPPQDCNDTRLVVPFSEGNAKKIAHFIKYLTPRGTTPIANTLAAAGNDFPPCDKCRNIIILITDGIEECNGDPCAVSQDLQKKGIVLKPFIIGIGQNFAKEFECVGDYYDGSTEEQFQKALKIVISYALNSTSCQVNLLDQAGNPTETNIPMTFYNRMNNKIIYQFVHTLNNKGVPDTLLIDPLIKYRIQIHTIPPVYIDSLGLTPGKHTIVSAPTPQGELLVKFPASNIEKSALPVIVRKNNENATLNVQYTNKKEKYLVGKYDLEILTLPRLYIDKVDIKQSYTTTVEIPAPGNVVIYLPANGYGSIFQRKKDKDLELVINLKTEETMQTIQLQPGDYTIVFRAKYVNKSIYTIEKNFTIESNKNTTVNLNFR